jgi:hypothetical protein
MSPYITCHGMASLPFLIVPIRRFLQGSSDEFIDANVQLALAVVRNLKQLRGTRSCIVSSSSTLHACSSTFVPGVPTNHAHPFSSSPSQVFPDQPEKRRASQIFKTAIDSVSSTSQTKHCVCPMASRVVIR